MELWDITHRTLFSFCFSIECIFYIYHESRNYYFSLDIKLEEIVIFEVFTAVTMNISVLCVTLVTADVVPSSPILVTLMMEVGFYNIRTASHPIRRLSSQSSP
jgi:hypothetical protein